ncbi:MAG: hypothetical protein J6125_02945 [Clostridia bacterium]|nr:hypothetical protein [Clostridia bacterium]
MKKRTTKAAAAVLLAVLLLALFAGAGTIIVSAATQATMTRQGDTIWFGTYPQTKATADELAAMSATPDADGFYTSGKDKFVKVSDPQLKAAYHSAQTDWLPYDDGTQPDPDAACYFKMEPIEWKVLIDDADADTVLLVSSRLLDAHAWLTTYEKSATRSGWADYDNTADGVPAGTPANGWRYSEMRAWLNDGFLTAAFSEEERQSILLFENTHTIDYREGDASTVVNDYIAVGSRADYEAAGSDVRPTDYAIVKGIHWQIDKNNCAWFVNEYPSGGWAEKHLRGFISTDHGQVLTIDETHGVRPLLYARRSDAHVLATAAQKKETAKTVMLIGGAVAAVAGAVLAVPVMITTGKKQKIAKKETGQDYKLTKKEVVRIAPGLVLLICGVVLIVLRVFLFGGGFGPKLQPGVYVQQGQFSGGGVAQVGYCAYRLNEDGTFDYNDGYDRDPNLWSGHGTWKQNGRTVTFVWDGNPMIPEGYTSTVPVKSSTSFGTSGADVYKLTP